MSCQYAVLGHEALLHISGPDSLAFLQGQTTCDTRNVEATQAVIGAYCTPKGRVVCDFLLCQLASEHFALRLRADILAVSAAVFGKYIVFSKADINTENNDWQVFACWGDTAGSTLRSLLGTTEVNNTPGRQYGTVAGEGFVLVQSDEAAAAFECYINTRTHPQLASQLAAAAPEVGENCWRALQIKSGMARIEADTVETFIPQMLNYDLTGHISFDKGCYTGQEVVARMHYRGKPKKRLYRATIANQLLPLAGAALYHAAVAQSAGTVVNTALGSDQQTTALVVAPVTKTQGHLHLSDPNGELVTYN